LLGRQLAREVQQNKKVKQHSYHQTLLGRIKNHFSITAREGILYCFVESFLGKNTSA